MCRPRLVTCTAVSSRDSSRIVRRVPVNANGSFAAHTDTKCVALGRQHVVGVSTWKSYDRTSSVDICTRAGRVVVRRFNP
jgi:hypothetical protein